MKKVIIAGGPGSLKKELGTALIHEHPEFHLVRDAFKVVLRRENRRGRSQLGYTPKTPRHDVAEYIRQVCREIRESERTLPKKANVFVLRKSLVDAVALTRQKGRDDIAATLQQQFDPSSFSGVLFCDYRLGAIQDATRQVQDTFAATAQAYYESGLTIVHIPAGPMDERLAFAEEHIQTFAELP